MTFKYFKSPEQCAAYHPEPTSCDCCQKTKQCFDAELFYGEKKLIAVCIDCMQAGKLQELEIYTNDADGQTLVDQLAEMYADKTAEEILTEAKEKTAIVESCTPSILSWQDWKFPALDGDYCIFEGFASRGDYASLAGEVEPAEFFKSTLHPDWTGYINLDLLWEQVPKRRIRKLEHSDYDVIFYLFKSTTTETYLTIWDTH